MADASGNVPGDPGYDASTDQNNTPNGDGTFTDNQGNIMDQGGGLIQAGPGADQSQPPPSDAGASLNQTGQALPQPTINPDGTVSWPTDTSSQQAGQPGNQQPGVPGAPAVPGQPTAPAFKMPDFSGFFGNLDNQLTALMRALSATNEQDFQQKVSEFNQTHALALQEFGLKQEAQKFTEGVTAGALLGTYNGQPTLAGQRQTAELSGTFNGQPTEQARQFNVGEAEKQRQFNVTTQRDLADLSSRLTGPADYFKFLNATNAGRSIIGSLQSGTPRPAFGQMAGNAQPQTLDTIFGRLGLGAGGSAFSPQSGGPNSGMPAAGTQNAQGMIALPNNMGYIPQPHMINPAVWDSWGKAGQEFVKGAASAAGLDPNWYESTINSTRVGQSNFGPATGSAFSSGGESAF